MDALIELREVAYGYPHGPSVLQGLDLRLWPGQRLGLLGRTGSGKTTLLHLIVGLLKPTAGEVRVFGQPARAEEDFVQVRRRVGLLFQDPEDQLFCPTVAEDVAFGPLNLGKTKAEAGAIVTRTLDSLGLAGYEGRVCYRLSGGEKRLVSLAGVLAMEPEVLLLDEPAVGLDETHADRVAGILADLPHPMIVVSHQQEFLRRVTDEVVHLQTRALTPAAAWPAEL